MTIRRRKRLSNKRCVWDWVKYNIRLHAISYFKEKAKQRNYKERQLQQEYKEATKLFEDEPSHLNSSRLNEVKEKLELFYEDKTKAIFLRARARWHEHSEKSTKYFSKSRKEKPCEKNI